MADLKHIARQAIFSWCSILEPRTNKRQASHAESNTVKYYLREKYYLNDGVVDPRQIMIDAAGLLTLLNIDINCVTCGKELKTQVEKAGLTTEFLKKKNAKNYISPLKILDLNDDVVGMKLLHRWLSREYNPSEISDLRNYLGNRYLYQDPETLESILEESLKVTEKLRQAAQCQSCDSDA